MYNETRGLVNITVMFLHPVGKGKEDEVLYSRLVDNYGEPIKKEDFVVLYLSYGGTCRCAMANAMTREKLKQMPCSTRIHSISAGLIDTTFEYASEDARKVISERLSSVTLDNHKTLKADFALLKRADVILPMDQRMKDAVPAEYASKAMLFTEMFGSTGDVSDPYQRGYSAYSESFQFIDSLVGRNIEQLCALAEQEKT